MGRVVVQRIEITWNKESRGAPGSSARNAVPEGFPLPEVARSIEAPCLYHELLHEQADQFATRDRFVPVNTVVADPDPGHCSVLLALEGDDLVVRVEWQSWDCGLPIPRPRPAPFRLGPGEWGRVRYGGRFVDIDTGDWWFKKVVYNLAHVERVTTDLFTAHAPARVESSLPTFSGLRTGKAGRSRK